MGDWSLQGGQGPMQVVGQQAGTLLTTVTGSANANEKWAWAALGTPTYGGILKLYVQVGAQLQMLMDIAIGSPGSEVVVVSNLLLYHGSTSGFTWCFDIPIYFAAGVPISVRIQTMAGTSQTVTAGALITPPQFSTIPGLGCSFTRGDLPATTTGTEVFGITVVNTKGSWVDIPAASPTPAPCKMLMVAVGAPNPIAARGTGFWWIDIGVNSRVIIPDIPFKASQGYYIIPDHPVYPVNIPAGAQLQARMQATSTSTNMKLYMVLYGFY